MLKKNIIYITLFFIMLGVFKSNIYSFNNTSVSSICNITRNQAEKYFKELAYPDAIKKYNVLLKNHCATIADKRNLALAYYELNNTKESEIIFEVVVSSAQAIAEDFYYYAQSLKKNEKYDEADKWFNTYRELNYSENSKPVEATRKKVEELKRNIRYTIEPLKINSKNSEFGAVVYNDKLVFTSARSDNSLIQYKSTLNYEPFLNVFIVTDEKQKHFEPLSKVINSKFHDGPVCFSSDFNEIFVTRSRPTAETKLNNNPKNDFILFYSRKTEDSWEDLKELPFNSPKYSCGHPSLTPDDRVLFFASDVPGGYGGADIYFVQKEKSGWSVPVNLGPNINTEGDEVFPFVSSKGELYFSSNGHQGLGGLDIFLAKISNEGSYEAVNMGYPLNSSADDFSFYLCKNEKEGYFASNRKGGKGSDDLYKFTFINQNIATKLIGTIKNGSTEEILPNASYVLFDANQKVIQRGKSDASGNFEVEIESEAQYFLLVNKENFQERKIDFYISNKDIIQNCYYLTSYITPQ